MKEKVNVRRVGMNRMAYKERKFCRVVEFMGILLTAGY